MRTTLSPFEVYRLKRQLRSVRELSLAASRRGDYRAVARLTCEATRLSQRLLQADGLLEAAR